MNAAMMISFLMLAMSAGGSLLNNKAADNAHNVEDEIKVIVDDLTATELSVSNMLRPSTHCWMSSITNLHRLSSTDSNNPFTSGNAYCAAMTEDQLDTLALELTYCELTKARRHMFIEQSHGDLTSSYPATAACPLGSSADQHQPYQASSCLKLLTDHAHSIYHQIRLHTKSLCSNLADDMFLRQKEEVSQLLALQIQTVLKGTKTTIEQLHFQSALLQNHSHLLKEHQMDLELMYEARKREEVSQTLLMEKHQLELEQMHEVRKREQAEEDRLRKMREDSIMALLQQQTTWMKSQQIDFQDMLKAKEEILEEKVKERMRELGQMQEIIATAQSQIRPLSKIESYVKMATDGFAIFKAVLNFFVSMNVVWMSTWLPFFNCSRGRLYCVFVLGFMVETLAILYKDNEFFESIGEVHIIATIRFWTRVCCFVICIISCLLSCLYPTQDDTDQRVARMDDLIRSQMDFLSQLNAQQAMAINSRVEDTGTEPVDHIQPITERRSRSVECLSRSTDRRSKSKPSARRSFAKSPRAVTPYRPNIDESVLTTSSTKAMNRETVKALKEMQRDNEIGLNSEDASSSSSDESFSASRTSSKINRKRKFSQTLEETHATIAHRNSRQDGGSISSVSTHSSSDIESKKTKIV